MVTCPSESKQQNQQQRKQRNEPRTLMTATLMKMMTLVKQEKSELVVSVTSPESHRATSRRLQRKKKCQSTNITYKHSWHFNTMLSNDFLYIFKTYTYTLGSSLKLWKWYLTKTRNKKRCRKCLVYHMFYVSNRHHSDTCLTFMYLIDIILTRVWLLCERLAAQLCVKKKGECFVSPFEIDCIFPTGFSFLFGLKC